MLFHPFFSIPFLFSLTHRRSKYTSSAQCSGLWILEKHSHSFEAAALLHSSFCWCREGSDLSLKRLLSCSICGLKVQRAWNHLLLSCVCSYCWMSTALWDRLQWDRFSLIVWKLFLLPACQFIYITHLSFMCKSKHQVLILPAIENYTEAVIPHPLSFQTSDSPESHVTGSCFSLLTDIYTLTTVTRFGGNVKSGDFSCFCLSSSEHEHTRGMIFCRDGRRKIVQGNLIFFFLHKSFYVAFIAEY